MLPVALCPACGSPALTDNVAGQCPRCLLGMVLKAEDDFAPVTSPFDSTHRQFGDYRLGRQIGAGGMGVVYEAHRMSDNRKVALKLIRDFHVASPTLLCRFTIEAEAVARLDHPNIVPILEAGDCDGHPFLSMEFVDGESLSAKITKGEFSFELTDQFTPEDARRRQKEVARLIAIVARAVYHAHLRGVLHRDLKPGNILIDAKGEPRLTDFGLAKILQADSNKDSSPTLTASGGVPGTPNYMAPEQVSDLDSSSASDIYGLGAVLYALFTGRPPFQASTPLDLFRQIVEQLPAPPRSTNPLLHADLETICLKCLEKDPRRRYGTAEALAEDLEAFALDRPIKACRSSPVYRTRHWIGRNRIGAALIASLFVGLSVSLGLLKIVSDQRQEIELDRDQAFDEGMQKVSQIWRDPATRSVTISARELAILAGRSPAEAAHAKHQLIFGASADAGPSSMAQRYARLLGSFQRQMEREIGEKTVFHLRLLKRFNQSEETLARGDIDFIVLRAVDFLQAEKNVPRVELVAHANTSREAVIFTRSNTGIQRLTDLRGKAMAFPDSGLSLTAWTKVRLFEAGLRAKDFSFCTNIVDQGMEDGQTVVSSAETVNRVLRAEVDASVTHRSYFERYRHMGLIVLDHFPDTPNVLAVRANLDPKLVAALRNAIHSSAASHSWPDNKFVLDGPMEMGPPTALSLDALRKAMEQADGFEQPDER